MLNTAFSFNDLNLSKTRLYITDNTEAINFVSLQLQSHLWDSRSDSSSKATHLNEEATHVERPKQASTLLGDLNPTWKMSYSAHRKQKCTG